MHLLNSDLLALLDACRATYHCEDAHGRSVYFTGDGRIVFASQAERGGHHFVQIVAGDYEFTRAGNTVTPILHGWKGQ